MLREHIRHMQQIELRGKNMQELSWNCPGVVQELSQESAQEIARNVSRELARKLIARKLSVFENLHAV